MGELGDNDTINDMNQFMAAIRRRESGSYAGKYNARGKTITSTTSQYYGERAYGAYQIMPGNWSSWSKQAGYGGAPMSSREAQDEVAEFMFRRYFAKYKSWTLVAIAWFGGPGNANKARDRGIMSVANISDGDSDIGDYVNFLGKYWGEAPDEYRFQSGRDAGFENADLYQARNRLHGNVDALGRSDHNNPPSFIPDYNAGIDPNKPVITPHSDTPPGWDNSLPNGGLPGAPIRSTLTHVMDNLSHAIAGGERSPLISKQSHIKTFNADDDRAE